MLRLRFMTWFYALLCALLLVAAVVLVMCHSPWFALGAISGATLAAWGFVSGHDHYSALQRATLQQYGGDGEI